MSGKWNEAVLIMVQMSVWKISWDQIRHQDAVWYSLTLLAEANGISDEVTEFSAGIKGKNFNDKNTKISSDERCQKQSGIVEWM